MASVRKGKTPGSGRRAGTPNRKTAEVAERLAALGCDPLTGLAAIAMDEANSPELRARVYSELAQYLFPKRRAIEVQAAGDPSEGTGTLEELLAVYKRVTDGTAGNGG